MFEDWVNFRKIKNLMNTQLRLAKANYIANLARNMKNEAPKFWRQVNFISGKSKSHLADYQYTPNEQSYTTA